MTRTQTVAAPPPIVKTIEVARPLDEAFHLFTAEMARWWPLASHSVGGADARWCGLEGRVGGRVYERTKTGDEHIWGTVTAWKPPHSVTFTWHPGQAPAPATEVTLRFDTIAGAVTRVTLEHRGWEALGARAAKVHGSYVQGWDVVLAECFGGLAGR